MANTYPEAIALIHDTFTEAEQWGQLAEELIEAAQAALKMQRLCMPRNKPRKIPSKCRYNMVEELADILNCLAVLETYGFKPTSIEIVDIRDAKIRRLVANIEADNAKEATL